MASTQFQREMNKIKTANMQDKDKLHSMICLLEDYEEMFEKKDNLDLLEECRDSIKVLKGTYDIFSFLSSFKFNFVLVVLILAFIFG